MTWGIDSINWLWNNQITQTTKDFMWNNKITQTTKDFISFRKVSLINYFYLYIY